MHYRKFGNSDLETSVIGFGGWPMGRGQYGSFDEDEMFRAVDTAIDNGVTLFDTAAVYGWGEGEKLMGRALKGRREKVVLVSKGGRSWDDAGGGRRSDSSREALRKGIEDSLQRLQTDYLDLYLIHWPDESRSIAEPMECFAEFQREGKIRYGGVSNFSAQQMKEALGTFPITCNQIGYHLFDHRPEPEQFPFCQQNGLGVMAYGSLAHGLLTGAMKPDHKFEDDDWRKSLVAFGQPIFEGEHYQRNLQKVDQLEEIAAGKGMTVAQLALSWVMSNPVISVALVGVRKPSEMEENLKAVDWQMTPEDREELRSVVLG